MASGVIHGRQGILYVSTSTGSTSYGSELGYSDQFTISPEKDLAEVTKLNQDAREYVEGLLGGSMDASGHFRIGDTILHKLINRFAKTEIDSTAGTQTSIQTGSLYFHGILRPIDTSKTSDAARGAKVVAELLPSNFSWEVSGGDVESWSYSGNINSSLLYVESTSTARGIPKAS